MKRAKIFALIALFLLSITAITFTIDATVGSITLKGKGNPYMKSDASGIRAGCDGENTNSCELTINPTTVK